MARASCVMRSNRHARLDSIDAAIWSRGHAFVHVRLRVVLPHGTHHGEGDVQEPPYRKNLDVDDTLI